MPVTSQNCGQQCAAVAQRGAQQEAPLVESKFAREGRPGAATLPSIAHTNFYRSQSSTADRRAPAI